MLHKPESLSHYRSSYYMDFPKFQHDDFKVVRSDNRHGGFEEVKHKDGLLPVGYPLSLTFSELRDVHLQNLCFFRKAVTPLKHEEFEHM